MILRTVGQRLHGAYCFDRDGAASGPLLAVQAVALLNLITALFPPAALKAVTPEQLYALASLGLCFLIHK